jgi:hypothetical protein
MDSEENKFYMNRLNPHSVDKVIGMSLFPPGNEFYNLVQGGHFKQFLSVDRKIEDGQNATLQYYDVLEE